MKRRGGRAAKISLAVVLTAFIGTAQAQLGEPVDFQQLKRELDEETSRLNALQRSLEDQERKLATDRAQLRDQRRRLEQLYDRVSGRGPRPASDMADADRGPAGIQSAQAGAASQPKPVGEAPPPEAEERKLGVAQIFQEPGILTPRGKFVVEPSLQFLHSSNNRVALVGFTIIPAITIGLIDIRRVSRDTLIGAITGRWGVTNRFEVEAKVPYVYAKSSTLTRPLATPSVADSEFDSTGRGIGDVEMAARYQLNQGGPDRAFYVGSFRVKTRTGKSPFDVEIDPTTNLQKRLPTGTGFIGLQPGITALFPSDPVVFFGGTSYLYNLERDVGNGFGRVRPGNVLDFNFGMGLALNEKSTFSIGYQHSIVGKPHQEGAESATKRLGETSTLQLGTLRFGFAYRLSPKTNLNLTLGAGVTREAPDLELTLRVPTTF